MQMLTWEEIQEQYQDQWVALTEWEEDVHGDITKGHVAYNHRSQNTFYEYLKEHLRQRKVATRYTGNVQGPFFLDV